MLTVDFTRGLEYGMSVQIDYRLTIGLLAGGGVIAAWRIFKKYFNVPCQCNTKLKLFKDIIDNNTLIAKHYLPELHIKLKDTETSNKYSLEKLVNRDIRKFKAKRNKAESGIVLGDEECYEAFREIIDPVIRDLYGVDFIQSNRTARFKACDWRRIKGGRLVDPKVQYCVLSTSRNIIGYPFPPALNNEERKEISQKLVSALNFLPVPLRGDYNRLCNIGKRRQKKLGLFEDYGLTTLSNPWPPFQSCDCSPDGRAVWWTENRKCKAFINFLDHIKFVISHPRGDLQQVLRDYMELVVQVEKILKEKENKGFAWHSKYGYLTSYLTDIGTGLHVEVKVRFITVHKSEFFKRLLYTKQIACNPCAYEGKTDTFIITNKNLIGTTEVDIIQHTVDAITLLLEIDKRLSRGEEIRDIMP